jgi:hypothetical protein
MSIAGGRINYKECRRLDICSMAGRRIKFWECRAAACVKHDRQKSASRSAEEETM